jgi:DNA-directed RNA polymerase subunit RPC12/RpoP
MSEMNFSCGHCGQHLTADPAWAGHQIKCPNCQSDLVVPQPAVASPPKPVSLGMPPAVPPPLTSAAAPAAAVARAEVPVKLWLLAVASLFLVFVGFFMMGIGILVAKSLFGALAGLVGLIPAILCAHAAINEKNSNRAAKSQASGAAAIIAYFGMALGYVLVALILFRTCQAAYYRMTGTAPARSQWSSYSPSANAGASSRPPPFSAPPAPKFSSAPARPADPPVTTDPQSVMIPDTIPSGTVFGSAFACTGIKYDPLVSTLNISQGGSENPQANVELFLFLNNQSLAGKSIVIAPNQTFGGTVPHVHLNGSNSKNGALTSGYVLRLEFSQPDKGRLTGRIYLELPQSYGTKISGTFKIPAQ